MAKSDKDQDKKTTEGMTPAQKMSRWMRL